MSVNKTTIFESEAAPGGTPGAIELLVLDDGGTPQLFAEDENDVLYQLTPPSTGSSESAANVFTFRPGSGLTGPLVFDTFDDLYNVLDAIRGTNDNSGKYRVICDDQDVGGPGNTVLLESPSGNITYDFSLIELVGVHEDQNVLLDIADAGGETDSLTITNALWFEGLTIRAAGQDTAFDALADQTFTLKRTTFNGDGEYVLDVLGVTGCVVHMDDESRLQRTTNAAIRVNTVALIIHVTGNGCTIDNLGVAGFVGGSVSILIDSSSAQVDPQQDILLQSFTMRTAAGYWSADPNGDLVAQQGTLVSDENTGTVWRNTDGAATWSTFGTGGSSALVVWTAAKTWNQVYAEITALSSFCAVLIEPSGANRNITAGTYDINGVRFIGLPQLNTASNGYGMVKVNVDAGVTFSQDGTTLFAVISSQDVFWYFDGGVQPVQQDKIRIRLDGGKMHADSDAVFTNITEARIYLTGGAHLEGYAASGVEELILLADGATCMIESYGGRLMRNVVSTPGTAFSSTVTAFIDPASVVQTGGSSWFRAANTTPTYNDFWNGNISLDATALAMLSPNATLHKPYILNNGRWSNEGTGFTSGSILFADGLGAITEDNPNLFYDDTNNFVGIGTNTPDAPLTVIGSVNVYAGTVTTFGGGSVYITGPGELRTDQIQHSTFPGGAGPIDIMVPISVRGGSGGLPGVTVWGGTFNTEGQIYLDPRDSPNTPSIGFQFDTNATATGYINDRGYQQGITQFRNLEIRDGKGAIVAFFDGATKAATFGGVVGLPAANSVAIQGGLEVYTSTGEEIFFGSNRETFWMGGVGATSMGTNYNTNGTATMFVNDVGYLGGITQFRDFQVNDGKGASIMNLAGATKLATFGGSINMTTSLFRGGTKVVGAQGAAIADAAGGVVIDIQARAQLNLLLAAVRAATGHGLIA